MISPELRRLRALHNELHDLERRLELARQREGAGAAAYALDLEHRLELGRRRRQHLERRLTRQAS